MSSNRNVIAQQDSAANPLIETLEPRLLLSGDSLDVHLVSQFGGPVTAVALYGSYVVACRGPALDVLDISNPASPSKIGSVQLPDVCQGLYVSGNMAYVADNLAGLQIIDLSNPAVPALRGSYANAIIGTARGVAVSGNIAYVAEMDSGLQIIDVSDPAAPVELGACYPSGTACGVCVSGNRAYVADETSGLQIIDVSNPAAPVRLGGYNTSGLAWDVCVSGNRAYVADDVSGLQIIDVTNPTHPARLGGYDTTGITHGVYVSGNLAYVADYGAGLQIINVSNPAAPVRLGGYDTSGNAGGVYLSGSLAYVEGNSGLEIVDVTDPGVPVRLGGYGTIDTVEDVCVSGNLAYVADAGWGLRIIDVSNPAAPILRGSYDTTGNAYGVCVSGNIAYVADYNSGLEIIDVSDPTAPLLRGSYDTTGSAYGVYVSDNLAYVVGAGLQIFDVSDPSAPVCLGHCTTGKQTWSVYVSGNLAYVADRESGLEIIDVSNPAVPVYVGGYDTNGYAYDVYVSGNLAYVADTGCLQIINVSDPAAPVRLGVYDTSGDAKGVYVSGNLAYVADFVNPAGLQIIDVTNPAAPVRVADYGTSGNANRVCVSGGMVYVADGAGGLVVLTDTEDPNDQISQAGSIAIGSSASGTISPAETSPDPYYEAADVDMYSVTVTAGQRLAFDIDRPSGTLDSYVRLFDSAGTQLASNDNAAAPGEAAGTDSYLEYTFATAGTYYVGVSGASNSAYNATTGTGDASSSTGDYTLTVTLDNDADDTIPTASAVTIGATITGNVIDAATDVDLFAVTVAAGQRLCFDIDRPSGTLDSYLRLFNSAGSQLAGSNNAPAPGEVAGTDSYFEYTFASAGTYYLGVSGNGNSAYSIVSGNGDAAAGTTGAYTLVVTLDADPDDTIPAATAVAIGDTVTGKAIDTATDEDLFAVTVAAGQRLCFDIDRPSGTLDSYIRLFNSAGSQLAGSNNAPAPGEVAGTDSYTEYTFATGGTYYLGVSANGNSVYSVVSGAGDTAAGTTGAYTLIVTLDADPDDTIPTATPIAIGSTVTGKAIDAATDEDVFSVTVTAGQRLCFDIDRPSGTLDSFIRLFNSAGSQLAGSNNAPAPGEVASTDSYLEYTFASAGTYYLGVSGNGNSVYSVVSGGNDTAAGTTGAYTLVVTLDADPDDTIPAAIATTVNSTKSNSIDTTSDVDVFAFTVTAGQRVSFDIDRPSGTLDSYIRLFNSAGAQLAGSNNAPAPGEAATTDSYLAYTFATAGTYYLGVSAASNNAYSIVSGLGHISGLSTGLYTLTLTLL